MNLTRSLRERLLALPIPASPRAYAVAFSGGLDSGVLLAALVRVMRESAPAESGVSAVRALHVDHGLHADSAHWARHCTTVAQTLGVVCSDVRVSVDEHSGQGLEAAARAARYQALSKLMQPGEVLLTAHHADDQLETLLMRMLRGTGVRGLRGIAECERFGPGWLARPLLAWRREELAAVARTWHLDWLDDPANQDLRHDRSFVRSTILPVLTARWPAAARNAGRLARWMGDTEELLREVAEQDAVAAAAAAAAGVVAGELPARCDVIAALSPARRRNLLRHLVRSAQLPLPGARQLAQIERAVQVTRPDAQPRVAWPGAEARVYQGRLYLIAPLPPASESAPDVPVVPHVPWRGPEGQLTVVPAGDDDTLRIPHALVHDGLVLRFRRGGERFHPAGRAHSQPLKKWLQEHGVLPWMRDRIPLLYAGEQLVAVADLCAGAQCAAGAKEGVGDGTWWTVRFVDHPPLQ